jgi:hypothetical protein
MSSAQQQSPDSAAKQIAGDSGSISNNNNNKPIVESTGIDSLRLSVDPHAMVDYVCNRMRLSYYN